MKSKLIEKPEYGALISPIRDLKNPIYNWHSYKHSYSKKLVEELALEFKLKPGNWVLDPFCGGGTTLLTCKQMGINSRGFDILPFSVYLSNVKTKNYDTKSLENSLDFLKANIKDKANGLSLPDIPLLKKAFDPKIAKKLLQIKSGINQIDKKKDRDFINLAFLSILENVSNTKKAGGFLRITERNINPKDIDNILFEKINRMIRDLNELDSRKGKKKISTKARIGDSRKIPTQREFDAIITSPPYLNRHDYTRIYSLEMVFDFVSSNDELKKIRYDTLRSHVEARKKYQVKNYNKPEILDKLISAIKSNGTNNSQVLPMLDGYFEDMYMSLVEMKRCLKKNGYIGLVVSNVRFAGINIPVDEILADLGEQAGLKTIHIWAARNRGNSSQQMGKYKRVPSRESIIIWEK
ncbi:MAG: DNA methyltransferase [Candidatus Hodarchaeales archaeon]